MKTTRKKSATTGSSRAKLGRYAAFLRGVSPMNLKMAELKKSLEKAGFTDVTTVLASGNVVFSAPAAREAVLAENVESAIERHVGRSFPVIVRTIDALREILASDPYQTARAAANAKLVVTFLRRAPKSLVVLPAEVDGARIVCVNGSEVYTTYVPSPRGPVFMTLIEKTFGKDVTTRTWDTVRKVASAGER